MGGGGRLNLFQRMMLRWRDLHPYNPVHVVRVPAALEPERLRGCIAQRLEVLGLTGLSIDRSRWRFHFDGGPADVQLSVATAGGDAMAALSRTIEREFNQTFPQGQRENPFRFVAIDEGDAFQLVLAYDHYVASGDSIARLLSGMACAYIGADEQPAPMERYSSTYRNLLLRHPLWVMRSILGLVRLVAATRHAYRSRYDKGQEGKVEDGHNAFTYLRLTSPQHDTLLATAKAWGITVSELLMASLMLALSPLAAQRRREPRRNELAIASILNMRADFGAGALDALSPFLAAFRVAHQVPEGIGVHELATYVHKEAARIRRDHLYLQSIMALGVSALLWPWLSVSKRHGLYSKHFPAWAGMTSLNLSPIWARSACAGTARLDYLRAVPTGPLCPLVFAVTRTHKLLHIGIAYRTAALSRGQVDQLAGAFLQVIDHLPMEPSA
jgi:hypothetical protein